MLGTKTNSRSIKEVNLDLETTPTANTLPFRAADFSNLAEALDYAALGETGCNFYSGRGKVNAVLSYAKLRQEDRKSVV